MLFVSAVFIVVLNFKIVFHDPCASGALCAFGQHQSDIYIVNYTITYIFDAKVYCICICVSSVPYVAPVLYVGHVLYVTHVLRVVICASCVICAYCAIHASCA